MIQGWLELIDKLRMQVEPKKEYKARQVENQEGRVMHFQYQESSSCKLAKATGERENQLLLM